MADVSSLVISGIGAVASVVRAVAAVMQARQRTSYPQQNAYASQRGSSSITLSKSFKQDRRGVGGVMAATIFLLVIAWLFSEFGGKPGGSAGVWFFAVIPLLFGVFGTLMFLVVLLADTVAEKKPAAIVVMDISTVLFFLAVSVVAVQIGRGAFNI